MSRSAGGPAQVAEERLQPSHCGAILGPRREALKERGIDPGIDDRHAPFTSVRAVLQGAEPIGVRDLIVSITVRVKEALSSDE